MSNNSEQNIASVTNAGANNNTSSTSGTTQNITYPNN